MPAGPGKTVAFDLRFAQAVLNSTRAERSHQCSPAGRTQLTELLRTLPRCTHDSNPSVVQSLHQSRGGSRRPVTVTLSPKGAKTSQLLELAEG